MIENEDISSEHDNNVEPVTEQTYTQTVDIETGNGLARAAIGGVVGAVLGTVALSLANKRTAEGINRSVKGVGNTVKNAAQGVNVSVKNAVEAVKGVANKGVNETVESASNTEQATTENINKTVERGQNIQAPVAPSQAASEQNIGVSDTQVFQLYEERLVANKKQVKTGEVAIAKHVETYKARISVPLEKERLVIEQLPVDEQTPVAPGEAEFYQRELVRMEIYEQTADIQKQLFVREQISVRKEVEHDTVEVEDNIRREELDLDVQDRTIVDKTNTL